MGYKTTENAENPKSMRVGDEKQKYDLELPNRLIKNAHGSQGFEI